MFAVIAAKTAVGHITAATLILVQTQENYYKKHQNFQRTECVRSVKIVFVELKVLHIGLERQNFIEHRHLPKYFQSTSNAFHQRQSFENLR